MGIATALDEYQACMEKIFGDLSFVVMHLNVILVFSSTEDEHLGHLRVVFDRLDKFHITRTARSATSCATPLTTSDLR
ncbi:hypothetical protein DVH05_023279 [Phytophthora capsici]|nr:hypothetical protein DVH05_023279 [Phytophthora capsici]